MLLPVLATATLVTLLFVAGHAALERRSLAADVRALRAELRQAVRVMKAKRSAPEPAPHPEPHEADAIAGVGDERGDDDAVPGRSGRTVH